MTEILLTPILISTGLGALGGILRILILVNKMKTFNQPISKKAFFVYIFIFLVIGSLSGLFLGPGKAMSLLGGYMGVDLMGVFSKSFNKKKVSMK